MTKVPLQSAAAELGYTSAALNRHTNWWGAFVIGLAGTILVTGIAPVMVTTLGASSIPLTIFITITGWLLCLLLAELASMMPDRAGGSPAYAYPAFKERWPTLAKHINGVTAWAYWLGWFPVAPLNMILASLYLANLFGLDTTASFTPIHTPIAYSTLVISIVGILIFFIASYLGIRFGAMTATILGLLSMIPLTFIAVAWLFNPSAVNYGEISGFPRLDGSSFFSDYKGANGVTYGWLTTYIAYAFLLTWNVIAMEAAACYIGECRDPDKDAKIAMNLEGGYGVFIYSMIPIAFLVVLGAKALSDPAQADPNTIFVTFAGKVFGAKGHWLDIVIGLMLIIALALSALNAIMGSGRALYQMSLDGEFPLIFRKTNSHGVPHIAMGFNTIASLIVVMLGGAVEIYTFSNVGYTVSFVPVLIGYYLLRNDKPNLRRPFRLPEFMKYVALAIAALYFIIWLYGGLVYSQLGNAVIYYWAGWLVLFLYLPFYLWRKAEDRRVVAATT
ncbi:APC family permease [Hyphomicrobium sp. 2TAF46]|uniref:APC family permease n=1 Tax=Hyphomicrobium sp. 2TAF46 TaxID=3233019 RepID=UPI003F9041EC